MLVRVVDYQANPGGGCRFVVEMLRAFRRITAARFEIVSHAHGTETYRRLVDGDVEVTDIPPRNARWMSPPWLGKPGARVLNALLRLPHFHFDVPPDVYDGCDLVWFPWLHRHRVSDDQASRSVATFHDCISLEFPGVLPEQYRRDEHVTTRRWLASTARIAVTSDATIATLGRIFGARKVTTSVIPLSAKHDRPPAPLAARRWPFSGGHYLLCPTNVSPHKNLETLLEGFAAWGARIPLVMTGPGTDLRDGPSPRQAALRRVIERCGLVRDRDFFALGYLDDGDYDAVLDGAWAMVIPTLAEGGGSFPALEAMERGIPVLSSDIPVMREMSVRWSGRLIWFDARRPSDLAAKLALLETGYESQRRIAQQQAPLLLPRSWDDVAREYADVMGIAGAALRSGE